MQIGRCLCCRRNVISTLQSGRQGAGTRRKHIESRERQTMRIPSVSSPVLHKCLRCHTPLPNRPYCIAKRPVSARGLALLAMPYGRFSIAVCPSWLCAWYSTVCPIGWPLLLSFTKCCRPIACRVYEKAACTSIEAGVCGFACRCENPRLWLSFRSCLCVAGLGQVIPLCWAPQVGIRISCLQS